MHATGVKRETLRVQPEIIWKPGENTCLKIVSTRRFQN